MAPAGWKNRLKEIEKLKDLLLVDVTNVEAHTQVASARVVADSKNKLLVSVKEIGGNGKAELIVALEKALVKHDLEFYANSPMMTGSLKTALSEFSVIEQKLGIVDDPEKYKQVDEDCSLPKNRSKGLPIDEARQVFRSHFARLGNLDKSPSDDIQKQIIHARRTALGIAEKDYIARQAKTLGVDLAESAKSDKIILSAEEEAKKNALERAYLSLPKEEALKAHPELAQIYKIEAAAKEFADESIGHLESRAPFIEEIRQSGFWHLAKGNTSLSARQTPQQSIKDLDAER